MRTRTRTARWRLQATPTSGWAASATVRYLPTYGVDRNATSQATALRICPSGIRAASACPPASRNNRLAARDLGRAPTRVIDTYMRRVTCSPGRSAREPSRCRRVAPMTTMTWTSGRSQTVDWRLNTHVRVMDSWTLTANVSGTANGRLTAHWRAKYQGPRLLFRP